MSYYLNLQGDAAKFKTLSFAGDTLFRDNLSRSVENFKDVTLTATQLDSLNATPVSVIAAPGAGVYTVLTRAVVYVDAGTTAFELGSGTLDLKYTDGSGASALSVANATVESASDVVVNVAATSPVTAVANAAIVAHATADVTAGNGTVYLRVFYRTVKISELA